MLQTTKINNSILLANKDEEDKSVIFLQDKENLNVYLLEKETVFGFRLANLKHKCDNVMQFLFRFPDWESIDEVEVISNVYTHQVEVIRGRILDILSPYLNSKTVFPRKESPLLSIFQEG